MDDDYLTILAGVFLGIALIGFIFAILLNISNNNTITLTQETANKVCESLTNVTGTMATEGNDCEFWSGCNLVCELPTYDHTQAIIIKTNDKEV